LFILTFPFSRKLENGDIINIDISVSQTFLSLRL